MPMFAKILHLNTQRDIPCLWAECDSDAEKRPRYYRIYGTGHPMLDSSDCYIGSFDMQNGALVFHVYESLSAAAAPDAALDEGEKEALDK